MTAEAKARTEDLRVVANEGVALAADHRGRNGPAFQPGELRLVVEEFELAGSAGHEQVDHRLGAWPKMRGTRRQRIASGRCLARRLRCAGQERSEGDVAQAEHRVAQEETARDERARVERSEE